MTKYSVQVVNNSETAWKFFVYQSPPSDVSDLTLAWFASPFRIPSGGDTQFDWDINYQFMWSATGIVKPGITFTASGQKDCDPQDANTTTFTFQDDTPDLSEPVPGGDKGNLYIHDGHNVPSKTFAVGVGMSGSGTFVVNAGPNLGHTLTPTPAYYIAAIDEVKVGEIMDIKTITQTAEIKFPSGVTTMVATLQSDNTWSITQAMGEVSQVPQVAQVPQVNQAAKGAKAQVKQQAAKGAKAQVK